ncbi:MAG: hypothetical protein LUD51_03890 [Clostridia bacterium]|nr:hypothetical protein [Clostridia bacterium]
MGREYCLSLDLGSDSLKIACAFRDDNGTETVLKVVDPRYSEIAVPAVACYDADRSKWLFGYEVGRSNEKSFATVVKIKDLLSIITISRAYYEGCRRFPLFEFPITNTVPESYYRDYVQTGRGERGASPYDKYFFTAPQDTPRSVCEQFFAYAARIIARFFTGLMKENFGPALNVSYTLVVPPKSVSAYVDEYQRLLIKAVTEARGYAAGANVSVQSSAKVLGMLAAYYDGLGERGTESALIFDIGEERISVVKFTKLTRGKGTSFNIDGITGHSDWQKLGGNDIDKALVEEIEKQIIGMGAMGTGDAGSADHLHEKGSRANNYLFMKSIKAAKVILGREARKGDSTDYPDGVPVSVIRDVDIYENVTQAEFAKSIGINPGGRTCVRGSVAYRIGDYIRRELTEYRSTNANASRIYLTGGAAGTAGLKEFVQSVVSRIDPGKKVKTFEDCFVSSGRDTAYSVQGTDIFSYGPSVGAAIVALRKDRIMVCLTKSYGTIAYLTRSPGETGTENRRFYSVIANMGSVLDFENQTLQRCAGEFRERYIKDASGNVQYKEYSQTYFLSSAQSDDIYIYSSSITDSSAFPDDYDVPEDIQKLYKDGVYGVGIGTRPVSYFSHVPNTTLSGILQVHNAKYGRVFLAVPHDSAARDPIQKDVYSTLESELGFRLEGGGNSEKVCMWYRNRSNLVTGLKVHDRGESPYDTRKKVYYVDVGVRIDKEGMAVTFARMTDNRTGETSNSGKTFDITYRGPGGTATVRGVQPQDLIMDFNRTISVDTGESLH